MGNTLPCFCSCMLRKASVLLTTMSLWLTVRTNVIGLDPWGSVKHTIFVPRYLGIMSFAMQHSSHWQNLYSFNKLIDLTRQHLPCSKVPKGLMIKQCHTTVSAVLLNIGTTVNTKVLHGLSMLATLANFVSGVNEERQHSVFFPGGV